MLPKLDGWAVCSIIRRSGDTPVIMLTALDAEEAQIRGFELEADDYITKPFLLNWFSSALKPCSGVHAKSVPIQEMYLHTWGLRWTARLTAYTMTAGA